MLASDVISRVRNLTGDITALQFTDTQLVDWINDAIKEIAVSNRLCQKIASQNLVIGTDTYSLPTDIFKIHSILINGVKIKLYTLQEWEEYNPNFGNTPVGNGMTQSAYIWANNLVLYPAPDQTYALKINYTFEPVVVAAATDLATVIPSSYHLRVVTYCLAQVAFQDDDVNKYNNLMSQFQQGVLELKSDRETEEDVYPSISMSTRDTGSDYVLW